MYINFELEDLFIVAHGILLIKFFLVAASFFFLSIRVSPRLSLNARHPGPFFIPSLAPSLPNLRASECSKSLSLGINHMSNQTLTTERLAVTLENDTRNITANHYHRIVGSFHGPSRSTPFSRVTSSSSSRMPFS